LADAHVVERRLLDLSDAEEALRLLASLYTAASPAQADQDQTDVRGRDGEGIEDQEHVPILEARYLTLLEQMTAVVFMAYLDRGIGEAYVSPQIEATLGFSQQEWLEDPVRWYSQIHPDEKERWSEDAAAMLLTGKPLRAVYRVIARDGHVVWFQCEAKMVRRRDGRPWFIQGVAFDISDLKQAETALHEERNLLSTILDTVGALVVVFDCSGRVVRFNRACELTTGRRSEEVEGTFLWDLFVVSEELARFQAALQAASLGHPAADCEATWLARSGAHRLIAWSSTVVTRPDGTPEYVVATGSDETERRRLQKAVLEIGDQEDRRIGQDLHDGLGQHLTGIAFMSKVLEEKLLERRVPESPEATKILELVNQAINTTRELARGLLPIVSDRFGLIAALKQIAGDFGALFRISCRFECPTPIELADVGVATQLCRLAREAVSNAIKHGHATEIAIELAVNGHSGVLTIRDNGLGFPDSPGGAAGLGLHIMRYRANMIGGTLRIDRGGLRNTAVTCVFPLRQPNEGI
jgi:PAS domain S-box-containing protein